MSQGFEIDREAFGQHAVRMTAHGDDYAAAIQRLKERGYAEGGWGDTDGLLSLLMPAYAESVCLGLLAHDRLSAALRRTGYGMHEVRRNIDDAEPAGFTDASAYGRQEA
ncbi:hypothetical protein E1295_25565 [Nonomuraea mesophila]|uniref:Uncharacterized protein n=1 Tax=Nonomuraea mesophila TaxID=2530382 RepID=A0A4R5F7M8_9ACTN|nr:hypothetical protein [Nonomuraea mesophila]TDE44111.1 hypothetical protein E1295_25565 [Nonomuraea mesophila]